MSGRLHIHPIVSRPFAENTYIVWREGRTDCVVIDPGLEPDLILDFLEQRKLQVAAILCTHAHGDHIGGNEAVKEAFPQAPIVIGVNEADWLTDANLNLSASFGWNIVSPPAEQLVREGDLVAAAGMRFEVLDIPGHSPGHVVYVYRDQRLHLLGGDVLFQGSIGRTDFPGSDGPLLIDGIRKKLYTLPDDTVVYPGHGPTTTTGEEKRTNPFVRA